MARVNDVKRRLKAGEAVVGSFCNLPSPEAVELLGWAGFDFVIIDAEHGPQSPETVANMVRGAEASGTTPLVRVATNEPQNILRYLDTGAQGLQMPMVNGPTDAQRAVGAALYPPQGRRGLAGVRAAGFGLRESVADYAAAANEEMLVIVQVETMEALVNLDAVISVPGIDVVFFGATDLSSSMGIPGQTRDDRVVNAITEAGKAVMDAGLVAGTIVGTAEQAVEWQERGFRYISTNFASVVGRAMQAFMEGAR
ncbi:MAG: hypothetical protein F4X20_00055 [Dehalococcoidia bacterium]|nr:hypothetical protein [Dehalococcoidia bacterium]